MKKLQELKEAMKHTPPHRLAKIEYQSHFLQIFGVSAVCGILIFRGFWWIIFAFVFSIGVSISQFISAYQKYHAIVDIVGIPEYDPSKDKSFTRSRDYIVKSIYGRSMKWYCIATSVLGSFYFIPYHTWYFKILFGTSIIVFYVLMYFYFAFYFANKLYEDKE